MHQCESLSVCHHRLVRKCKARAPPSGPLPSTHQTAFAPPTLPSSVRFCLNRSACAGRWCRVCFEPPILLSSDAVCAAPTQGLGARDCGPGLCTNSPGREGRSLTLMGDMS